MSEVFGNFIEQGNGQEFLIINFSPNSIPLQQRWRNNGLSADFLSDYWSTFFPADDEDAESRSIGIKGAVAYVANELLENAMKFTYEPAQHAVNIGLHLHQNEMFFYVTNTVDPAIVAEFQAFIHQILTEDPDELYMKQLEANANEDDIESDGSHLGFLTMINDYHAEIAWKFTHNELAMLTVTTMVRLAV